MFSTILKREEGGIYLLLSQYFLKANSYLSSFYQDNYFHFYEEIFGSESE